MSMIENEKNENEMHSHGSYNRERGISGIRTDCGADYVLPDYMGDVKRLLRCTASVVPCNKFVSDGELSFLFDVNFKIMYLDSENMLTEASFGTDFEHSERIAPGVNDASVDTRVHNVTVRLGGPRKISAKASLLTDISLFEEERLPSEDSYRDARFRKESVRIHTADYYKCAEREYAEELERLENLVSDEVDVVKYDAEAYIDAVHHSDNGVNLSGYIDAYCILKAGEDLLRIERRIPVEENLAVDDCGNDSFYLARCYVTGATLNINNTPEDKEGNVYLSVVMNLTLECEAEHHRNCEVTLVTDAFREGEENVCSYETFNYNELVGVAFERRKESASCERGEENIHDILAKHASVKNIKYEISDGELTASFDLALSLVARSADNGECFTVKLESPFSEKIKSVGVSESSKIRINITPCEISPAFDSERIYADCDVIITVLAEDAKSVKILRELSSKKKERTDCRRITVYYPENGDTLWSVSKKYGVSPEKIAYANMMEADNGADLASRGKIIIP